jgi:hypothetical protein
VVAPDAAAIELEEMVFLAPFPASERPRSLRLSIERATGDLVLASGHGADRIEHVRGVARSTHRARPAPLDVAAMKARCTRAIGDATPNLRHLKVGPRWASEAVVGAGPGEIVATVRFPAAFAGELGSYEMHPALLDVATACSLWLVETYSPERDFYVPLSYGRVTSYGPLPETVVVHARASAESNTTPDLAVCDFTIADPSGRPLVVVERFAARRLAPFSRLDLPQAITAPGSRTQLDLTHAIRPEEGARAFLAVLRSLPLSQVVVGPASIDEIREAVARMSAGAPADQARAHGGRSSTTPLVGPRDDLERSIAAIWSDLLGTETIGIDDNFFELGGHSLLLTQVGSRIRRSLKAQIPITTLFEHPTIRAMADAIRSHKPAEDEPALVAVPRETLRRTKGSAPSTSRGAS